MCYCLLVLGCVHTYCLLNPNNNIRVIVVVKDEVNFADAFDRILAISGPSGLFTLTHDGCMQFDLFRTRDWRRRFCKVDDASEISWNHCVCIDSETKWPLYVLMTADVLVCSDERTLTRVFDTMGLALQYVAEQKAALYAVSQNTQA